MIQFLTYTENEEKFQGRDVIVNSIHDAQSLDDFSIDIICLQNINFWENKNNNTSSITCINDFSSLSDMIKSSIKANIIILFPQNYSFYYNTSYDRKFWGKCEIKNKIDNLKKIMSVLYPPIAALDIIYENTQTKINDELIPAAFSFNNFKGTVLTKSDKSEKTTTVKMKDIILSTLEIKTYEQIIAFLKAIGLLSEKQERPSWMEEISMFDDDKQIAIIRDNQTKIQEAEVNIREAREVIDQNNKYKSILYTNGEELVEIVLKILEEMLGCDFSDFEDVKREDFLTTVGEYTFIGEIKGVNHNVKSENVAQLDRHYQSYLDDNPDADTDKVCALLIMNYQKNKPVQDREPVHEQQISLARRNRSLIIDTYTLLKLFEKYLSGEKSREECIDILQNNIGLLSV